MQPRFQLLAFLSFVFSLLGGLAALVAAFNALRMVAAADYYWLGVYCGAFVGGLLLLAVGEFIRMAVEVANVLLSPSLLVRHAPAAAAPANP